MSLEDLLSKMSYTGQLHYLYSQEDDSIVVPLSFPSCERISPLTRQEALEAIAQLTSYVENVTDEEIQLVKAREYERQQHEEAASYKPIAKQKRGKLAWVYFIRAGETDHYKIGVSYDTTFRLKALQSQSPQKLELIARRHETDAWGLEKRLHERFSACRTQGEWFCLTDAEASLVIDVLNSEAGS